MLLASASVPEPTSKVASLPLWPEVPGLLLFALATSLIASVVSISSENCDILFDSNLCSHLQARLPSKPELSSGLLVALLSAPLKTLPCSSSVVSSTASVSASALLKFPSISRKSHCLA